MKVTTVGRSNYSRIFFVVAALGAVYLYRRQGGNIRALFSRGLERGVGMIQPMVEEYIGSRTGSPTAQTQSTAPSATI